MDWPELLSDAMERYELPNQEALALHLGITQSAMSKWMRRSQTPSRSSWSGLAEKLGVPIEKIAVAIANTQIDKKPSTAAQLRECQKELEQLRAENARLRAHLQGRR